MLEWIDSRPDVCVLETEYKRLLGFPGNHLMQGRSRELADRTRQWFEANGKPWIYARQAERLDLENDGVRIDGALFTPSRLRARIRSTQAHSVVLVAISAGAECERMAHELWHESKPDEYFFMEMFGSAVVEHLVTTTGARICAWAEQNGMTVLPHDSPGYSGWDISEQIALWNLIQSERSVALPGEIQVLPTGMLQPKKSLLAVFGVTRLADKTRSLPGLVPCEECSFRRCQYRRAPYRNFPPQLERISSSQPVAPGSPTPMRAPDSVLDHQARYSINPRALHKWSKERLGLNVLEDGSVEARFRYEGTTCSNLGQPLAYDYFVKLAPATHAYRILESECRPAPGDAGHTCMCEYLKDSRKLSSAIASEKPLLGRPLEGVLGWQRPHSPSGCYCEAASRDHKWGLVLEVIHYALVQQEQTANNPGQPAAISK